MEKGKIKTSVISLFLLFLSCGFAPDCLEPKAGDMSYPVDGIIVDDRLYVLNSNENYDYCSSFISAFKIEGAALKPADIIFPKNYEDFTLAGRLIFADGRIFVTERGKGMVFIFSEKTGEVISYFEEGGNPYNILFLEGEGKNFLVTANIKLNTVNIYEEWKTNYEKIYSFTYPYPPASMLYDRNSKRIFVALSGSSEIAGIDFDPANPGSVSTKRFTISPDGSITSLKSISVDKKGMYAIAESPPSLIFVDMDSFSPSLLHFFRERIFSVEIIEEKNLLLAISPLEDVVYGFSLNPFLFLWRINVKGNPVRGIYSQKTNLIYFIPMMEKKIKVFNPQTMELK